MGSPLTRQNLSFVVRELDEVATAASVTGSGKSKLRELATMATEIAGELHGRRSSVEEVRKLLYKEAHDVRFARYRNPKAVSKAIRDLRDAVKKARDLVTRDKLGDTRVQWDGPGGFFFMNVWGYTKREMRFAEAVYSKVARKYRAAGVERWSVYAAVRLDDGGDFCEYLPGLGVFGSNPTKHRQKAAEEVFAASAGQIWLEDFGPKEHQVWGDNTGRTFERAFVAFLADKRLNRDTRARLKVTLGVPA